MHSHFTSRLKLISPFIVFLPFLMIYILIVLLFSSHNFVGDEERYITYAENLINGFYSPAPPNVDLGNGPGYPVLIMPFLFLGVSLIWIKLLNAVLLYLSVVYLYKSLNILMPFGYALSLSLIWAIYPNNFEYLPLVLTEILAVTLTTLFLYFIVATFHVNNLKYKKTYIFLSGFSLAYLALVKPIFGYVILTLLIGSIFLFIFRRKDESLKIIFHIMIKAFLFTLPYLFYTYTLTNKVFYWGSSAGNNFYWLSNPNKHEYGDWMSLPRRTNTKFKISTRDSIIANNHKDIIIHLGEYYSKKDSIIKIGGTEYSSPALVEDSIYKKFAIKNILNHPGKFVENLFSNASRIIINYPYSYKLQSPSTLIRFPINGLIFILSIFALIISITNWNLIPFDTRFLLFFASIYFGGSLFGSAETRMFSLIVPILLVWIGYILKRSVSIKFKWN